MIDATTLGELVDRAPRERDALVFPDVRLTYGELADRTDATARSLYALGIRAGDKVGILLGNRLEFVLALFGAAKLGAVVVPVNARFKTHELGHVITHADVKVLVTSDEYLAMVPDVAIVNVDREGFPASDVEIDHLKPRVRVRDIAVLMYTSGTSAKPKGCLLTHEALVRHGANVARERFYLTAEDTFWDPLPLFHIGGIVPMLGTFSVGAKFVHAGHFEPGHRAEDARSTSARRSSIPAFETIWLQVLDHPDFDAHDLSSIRVIQSICVPERLRQLEARMPYAAQVSLLRRDRVRLEPHAVAARRPLRRAHGHARASRCRGWRSRSPTPRPARRSARRRRRALLQGYALFEGYYKDPELTAACFDADGFFHSQDLAEARPTRAA